MVKGISPTKGILFRYTTNDTTFSTPLEKCDPLILRTLICFLCWRILGSEVEGTLVKFVPVMA